MLTPRIAGALLLAAALTACSTVEPGSPSASSDQESGTAQSPTTRSSSGSGGTTTGDVDSCEVLTSVAGQNDLREIKKDSITDNTCFAKTSKRETVHLTIYPDLSLEQYQANSLTEMSDTTVGSRPAKKAKKAVAQLDCVIAIEISPTSRADVFAYSINSLDEACAKAEALAKAVEPSLPKG
ncbi:hypothetical protein [Actinosynnema mirum]|uniref:hypothetical protein n=1 Tax=Actinosynnema mirum TaxID=40567 RepID=UPI00019AB8AC|nr:hypothetical protein [Actinosynnema mirum]